MRRLTVLVVGSLLASVLAPGVGLATTKPEADTVGLVDTTTARWYLMDEAGDTATFIYGNPGDVPIIGDWDCDGFDSPGMYRQSDGYVYLRNISARGKADIRFFFGDPDDVPIAGDFNGDGCDTVSLYRPSQQRFYIINELGGGDGGLGVAEFDFHYGDPGDEPLVGDFDGDGMDTVGLYRPSAKRVFLLNAHRGRKADVAFAYGRAGDRVLMGHWESTGVDTVGAFRPGDRMFHLRDANAKDGNDRSILFGRRHMVPVGGRYRLGRRAESIDWRSVTVAVSGDVLIHTRVSTVAGRNMPFGVYDFRPMFRDVKPIIREADLAICHLEVPLSRDNTGLSTYPRFYAPHEVADAIADAGYAGCSTASNHSFDQGVAGVVSTLDVMDDAGLGHAGTARSAAEAAEVTTYELPGGLSLAHLSYTYWLNGLRLPPDKPWLANIIDTPTMLADAATARGEGADIVMVSIHAGNQYQVWPNAQQLAVARALTASPDVDLVVGHHAHWVQPIGVVNGKHVVYGVGNFLSGQVGAERQDGVIVFLELVANGVGWAVNEVRYEPTHVDRSDYRVLPVNQMLAAGGHGYSTSFLQASLNRTRHAINLIGAPHILLRVPAD